MKPHVQCAEQQVSPSNLTKYCACHAERLTYWVLITYETSFTMRGATGVTIQPHQILRLSRKKTHILSPHHIWNVIYSTPSNRPSRPTSPNTAPATQNDHPTSGRNLRKTGETSFPTQGRSENDPTMIRPWNRQSANPPRNRGYLRAQHEHFLLQIQHFAPNLTFKHSPSAAPATKSVTWPSPSTAPATKSDTMVHPHHISNLIYNARSNRCHHQTSPNTAPVTQNDSHSESSSHIKPHLHCAEQQVSPSNLTKYCACHEKWHCKILEKISKNRWNVISNAGTIRAWSEHDPTMKTQTATRLATEVTFRAHHEHFLLKTTTFRAQSYIQTFTKRCACHEKELHQVLHLPRKVQPHQILRLPRKMTLQDFKEHLQKQVKRHFQCGDDPSMIRAWSDHENANRNPPRNRGYFSSSPRAYYWKLQRFAPNLTFKHSPSAAPATKSNTWTSPSTAPATKSDTWTSPTLLDTTLLDTTLLDTTLLETTLLETTLFETTLLDSTLLDTTLLDTTLLDSTLLDTTLLGTTLLDSSLLDSTLLETTLRDTTLLDTTLLDSTLLDTTLLDTTLLDTTLLDTTLLDTTLLDTTLLDTTLLDSTLLDSTLLDSTLLNFTGMSFVYRKFLI